MCGSWDMEHSSQIFLSFWAIFCPITLLTTWKIKTWKKHEKSIWRYYHFTHVCHINDNHMIYFGSFLPFHPTKTLKNQNLKTEKNACTYHHLDDIITWRYHHQVGAPSKNSRHRLYVNATLIVYLKFTYKIWGSLLKFLLLVLDNLFPSFLVHLCINFFVSHMFPYLYCICVFEICVAILSEPKLPNLSQFLRS